MSTTATDSRLEIAAALDDAANELRRDPTRWIKGSIVDSCGHGRSIVGITLQALTRAQHEIAWRALAIVSGRRVPTCVLCSSLQEWNDAPGRRLADVVRSLSAAAELLREETAR